MKIVVTGGAGFIGANLCRALTVVDPERIVVLDDLSTGSRSSLDDVPGVTFVEGSILETQLLDEVITGADSVIHLAALPSVPRSVREPVASHVANATGTVNVLEAVRRAGGPHVVVASSSSVYGANEELPKREDMALLPVSPYAASKLAAEAYALAYAHSYDLDVLVFRFFNVFGPLQPAGHAYAAVIPAFVDALVRGEALTVHGDGTQTRDFTFVDSVTAVIVDATVRRVTSPVAVNLAFGSRHSLLEVIEALERLVGSPVDRRHTDSRPGDVHDSQADTSRLRALFPEAEPVPLDTGLERTLAWFRSRME